MRPLPLAVVFFSVTLAARAARADEATPRPPEAVSSGRPVTVELHTNDGRATIERRTGSSTLSGLALADLSLGSAGHWETVCVAPCVARLDALHPYRVGGDGLVPTSTFSLPSGRDRVRVDATLGSSNARALGILMTAGGAAGMALGGAALIASPIFASEDVGSQGFRTAVLVGGTGVLALSTLVTAAGLYLWLGNGSSVRLEPPVLGARPEARSTLRLGPGGLTF